MGFEKSRVQGDVRESVRFDGATAARAAFAQEASELEARGFTMRRLQMIFFDEKSGETVTIEMEKT
jgi:hypothetical protein